MLVLAMCSSCVNYLQWIQVKRKERGNFLLYITQEICELAKKAEIFN
jgi:hypothetical protein